MIARTGSSKPGGPCAFESSAKRASVRSAAVAADAAKLATTPSATPLITKRLIVPLPTHRHPGRNEA